MTVYQDGPLWGGGGGLGGVEVCWQTLQILTLFKTKIIIIVHFASLSKTRDLLSHLWFCFTPEIMKCF